LGWRHRGREVIRVDPDRRRRACRRARRWGWRRCVCKKKDKMLKKKILNKHNKCQTPDTKIHACLIGFKLWRSAEALSLVYRHMYQIKLFYH
jgi:hypothetical protein